MIKRLALGTAQLGSHYGINNKIGKISSKQAFQILYRARRKGVTTLDTAEAYGDSEQVIGEFIKATGARFRIISKFFFGDEETPSVARHLESSLARLGVERLYGYLIHNFKDFENNPSLWKELQDLKKHKRVEKIGFSLYFPCERDVLLKNNIVFDLIRVPYSVFDRRFEGSFKNVLPQLKTLRLDDEDILVPSRWRKT